MQWRGLEGRSGEEVRQRSVITKHSQVQLVQDKLEWPLFSREGN